MPRYASTSKSILIIIILVFMLSAQTINASSPSINSDVENQTIGKITNSKDTSNIEIAVHFNKEEISTIVEALPKGNARQLFNSKVIIGKQDKKDELYRKGESLVPIFYENEKVVSQIQKQVLSLFTESKLESREWVEALNNLNMGKGIGHFLLTLFIMGLFIVIGFITEWLIRRPTKDLRRQILESTLLGRLQFFGRIASRLLLDLLGLCAYTLTTFLLCALFYDDGDPGFLIVSSMILLSYYFRFFILAANIVLSPTRPALRFLPLQDANAKFLFRWTIIITATAMVIGTVSYDLQAAGLRQELFHLVYSLSGLSITLLLVVMVWKSRRRVAQLIWTDDSGSEGVKASLRARFANSWHFFAVLYVLGIGIFWFIKAMAEGQGAILPLLISLFLVPIFICIYQWVEYLLNVASGVSSSTLRQHDQKSSEAMSDYASDQVEIQDLKEAAKKIDIQRHLPLMKGTLRILLAAVLFFLILRLWGIDLPLGRVFTSTTLNIIVVLLLGFAVWQYAKTRIDRKLSEEMPDEDEEMEEGGSGGSRLGTLLMLLRKFILSVLFVLITLIILSSIGVEIGPLIAGAGVIGLAIGFGSQTLVRDILSGVFFLIDDAFRVGDYIETSGIKGTVQHISLRSVKLRHPRGMLFTIPFGDMGAVQNFSRDYIITKLDFRVRYDTDVEKVRKAIKKKVYKKILENKELAPKLLDPIKSQGVRHLEDSAMIMRVKYKTAPGDQFEIRKEVYRLMQEAFKEEDIEFAHRNVTVYMPSETTQTAEKDRGSPEEKIKQAAAAAAIAADQTDKEESK